jgi:hypothetical protein
MCSLNINGWEMMISIGFLAATGYVRNHISFLSFFNNHACNLTKHNEPPIFFRVRVANELGAGSARRAKFAIYNVVVTSFAIGLVLFVLFLFFRGSLAYIFTESQAVAAAVADLSPLLAFSILLNSVQPVLSGVAVGAGWQGVVAYVNVTSYYLIGIPLGAVLGYVVGLHVKVRCSQSLVYIHVPCMHGVSLIISASSSALISCRNGHVYIWTGHLDRNAARNAGPDYRASLHNSKDRLGQTGLLLAQCVCVVRCAVAEQLQS